MEQKQIIISVSREFGSGGHEIATRLAEIFNLPLYDRNLLDEIAEEKMMDVAGLQKYDERPKNRFLSKQVRGYSSSHEENVAQMQFELLKKKASEGGSFVVVGRCSEFVLKDCPGIITVFVLGDWKAKLDRIMERYQLNERQAEEKIWRHDRKRKAYHNNHCKGKWGDSRNYDVCINSSKVGIEETIHLLQHYIEKRSRIYQGMDEQNSYEETER